MMSGTTTRKDNCKEILNREEVWNNRRKHVWDNRKDVWDNRTGGLSRWLSRWGRCQALPVRQGLDPRLDWSQHWNYFLGRYTSMFYRNSCLSKISIVTQVGELTNKQLRIVIILVIKWFVLHNWGQPHLAENFESGYLAEGSRHHRSCSLLLEKIIKQYKYMYGRIFSTNFLPLLELGKPAFFLLFFITPTHIPFTHQTNQNEHSCQIWIFAKDGNFLDKSTQIKQTQ